MILKLKQISFCLLPSALLIASSFGTSAFAATVFQDNRDGSQTRTRKHLPDSSARHQAARTKGKHGQRTIIFVGGRRQSQGAAKRSNPTDATKSNGSLN